MKKLALLFVFIFSLFSLSEAQTNISGSISGNTTWTLAGSPYIITGNTILDSGFILTINPGVKVRFDSATSLQINGTLRAKGNSSSEITFTSNKNNPAPGDWDYIYFNTTSTSYDSTSDAGCIMEHCIVEYAAGFPNSGTDAAIRIESVFPLINYCTVRNNLTTGIGYFIDNPPVPKIIKITNCEIYNNVSAITGGIEVNTNLSEAYIYNNKIYNNKGSVGGGIYCSSVNNLKSIVYNNLIYNNTATYGGGIYIGYSFGTVSYNMIYNNTADYGAGIWRDNLTFCCAPVNNIFNNIIVNNKNLVDYGVFYDYGGLSFYNNTIVDNIVATNVAYFNTNGNINYNTITRNKTNTINPTATFYIFNIPGSETNNNIYGNSTTYEMWNSNSQPNDVNAKNCWWGTTSTSAINAKLHDSLDDSSLGMIYYRPFQTSPDTNAPVTPPVNVVKNDLGGDSILLTWNANTETDLAGYKVYWGSPTGYSFADFKDVGNVTSYILPGLNYTDTIAITAYDKHMDGVLDRYEGHESWFTGAIGIYAINFSGSPLSLCKGDAVHFIDSTADIDSWQWTFPGGTPGSSKIRNPVVIYNKGGKYDVSLKVTNIAGSRILTKPGYINVSVPVAEAGQKQTVCAGSYVTLTATGGTSYQWNYGITQGVPFIPAESTLYYVTVTDSAGCKAIDSVWVTVNFAPDVFISPKNHAPYCPGTQFFLNAYNADTYTWSPDTGLNTSTGAKVTVTASTDITYTVVGLSDDGCWAEDSVAIQVYPKNTITVNPPNPAPFCPGDTVTLIANGSASYVWSPSAGLNTNYGSKVIASPTQTITYTIRGLDNNGCFTSDSVIVTLFPKPHKPIITRKGDTLISDTLIGNQWYNINGGLIPNATGYKYIAYTSGIYYVVVTGNNNCQSDSSNNINVVFTGIPNSELRTPNSELQLYPNPANSLLVVSYSLSVKEQVTIKVYDLTGNELAVLVNEVMAKGKYSLRYNVSSLSRGLYFLKLSCNKGLSVIKFIKE